MSLTIRTQKSEFTFYDYRSFYIDTLLLGSCYGRAELKREGIRWLDLWWGDDERTVYNLSIGKWCMTCRAGCVLSGMQRKPRTERKSSKRKVRYPPIC